MVVPPNNILSTLSKIEIVLKCSFTFSEFTSVKCYSTSLTGNVLKALHLFAQCLTNSFHSAIRCIYYVLDVDWVFSSENNKH